MNRHLSIDIETLGTLPGSVILSIGVVAFDPWAQQSQTDLAADGFEIMLDVSAQEGLGMFASEQTLQWWSKQNAVTRAMYFNPGRKMTMPDAAFTALREYYAAQNCGPVWANGPAFDCVLVEEFARRAGNAVPWQYWDHRDIRTLRELTGRKPSVHGTAHCALDDAAAQAQFVQDSYRALGIQL